MSENNTNNTSTGSGSEPVIDNHKLEQAIVNLNESNTQINTQRVIQLLCSAKLVVPFNISDEDKAVRTEEKKNSQGEVIINKGASINLVFLTNEGTGTADVSFADFAQSGLVQAAFLRKGADGEQCRCDKENLFHIRT